MDDEDIAIALVRGETPAGNRIYAFVAVPTRNLQAFLDARDRDGFQPGEYGALIEQGEGEPSEAVKQRMKVEHGYVDALASEPRLPPD